MSIDIARMPKISTSLASPISYVDSPNGSSAARTKTAATTDRCTFFDRGTEPATTCDWDGTGAVMSGRPSEQSERTERKQHRHRAEYHEIGEFREHHLAKGIEQADQQASHRDADGAATTADDDDGEAEDENTSASAEG